MGLTHPWILVSRGGGGWNTSPTSRRTTIFLIFRDTKQQSQRWDQLHDNYQSELVASDGTRIQTPVWLQSSCCGPPQSALFGEQRSWLIGYSTWGPAGMQQVQKEWKVTVHASKPGRRSESWLHTSRMWKGSDGQDGGVLRPLCPSATTPHCTSHPVLSLHAHFYDQPDAKFSISIFTEI